MLITTQLFDFIGFFLIGILIAIIFDFFRTYRLLNKTTAFVLIIQVIIYLFISTSIIILGVINILDSSMRLYIFFAIVLGCVIYYIFFSKYIIKLYSFLFRTAKAIFEFIFLPINLTLYIIVKICIFIKKMTKKCCKKFFYVVTLIQNLFKNIKFKTKDKKIKEGINNEESV